ncbi:MAG: alpha/beta fold hydrolase [Cytophagales bacterium]|nr:alpha/beta fold hydrolase [Armatimonadota bacterium]
MPLPVRPTPRLLPAAALLVVIALGGRTTSCAAQPPAAPEALPPPPPAAVLRGAYAYTPARPFPVTAKGQTGAEADKEADTVREHIVFTNTAGSTVTGTLLLPKGKRGMPCVLLLHGAGSDKETMVRVFGDPLAKRGVASLSLDAAEHGERKTKTAAGAAAPPSIQDPRVFARILRTTVSDYRQALDYLQTRQEVDARHIGLLGYSMGAMMGAMVAGVDERVAASVLCVGGDPVRPYIALVPKSDTLNVEAISPSNYVGLISPRPVYLLNAKDDKTMPAAAARRLQEAAKEPKTVVWAEGGHILPSAATRPAIIWLTEKLTATPAAPNPQP